MREFEATERTRLRRIARHLREQTFDFGLAKGVPIARPGKGPRPIVVASVEARIVQRVLLDELQRHPRLQPHFINENSFGGVQGRGRRDAIRVALRVMGEGARFFVRSDIKDFFTRIPKQKAFDIVLPLVDAPTQDLLRRAVDVELANAEALGALRDFFPDEERGVAQGFCLSSLFGNIVLGDFDRQMNDRGVRCLRYVDDFLLLADGERRAMKAFESALRILHDLGLEAYDPRTDAEKAESGPLTAPFDFLGCAVQPGLVAPSKKAKVRLLEKVDERIRVGRRHIERASGEPDRHASFARVMTDLGNIVHGWRESFDFCEHPAVFDGTDQKLDKRLDDFVRHFWTGYARGGTPVRRALIGVPILAKLSERRSSRSSIASVRTSGVQVALTTTPPAPR